MPPDATPPPGGYADSALTLPPGGYVDSTYADTLAPSSGSRDPPADEDERADDDEPATPPPAPGTGGPPSAAPRTGAPTRDEQVREICVFLFFSFFLPMVVCTSYCFFLLLLFVAFVETCCKCQCYSPIFCPPLPPAVSRSPWWHGTEQRGGLYDPSAANTTYSCSGCCRRRLLQSCCCCKTSGWPFRSTLRARGGNFQVPCVNSERINFALLGCRLHVSKASLFFSVLVAPLPPQLLPFGMVG